MATHDYVLANASGAAFRADLNNALAAIVSNNSSTTEPATTYAYMWWADTANGQLKRRNAANDGWIVVQQLDGTFLIEDGTVSNPGLAFADDLDTGLFRPGANQLAIATNGVERIEFGASEVVVNDGGADVDFRVEGDTEANLLVVDAGNDRIGIAESAPGTLVEIGSETPYVTLKNSTEEDTDGGRESRLIFEGEQSGGEISSLAQIEVSHDGSADDEKGKLIISTNDGSDGAAPTTAVTVDSDQNVTIAGSLTASGINYPSDGALSGTRNRIINGDFSVAQRGTSFVASDNNDDTYTLDRWYILSDGNDAIDVTQETSTVPTNQKYAIALDVETANKKFGIAQIIENVNCVGLTGNTVTLSFKAKVSSTTKLDNVKAAIVAWSGTADTVTSDIISAWGAEDTNPTLIANATYENTPTNLNVTTSYATYTVSAAVDTASTSNIIVFIWSDVTDTTAGDFLYVTDVQLEPGTVATPFERRSYGQELALCQRYYQKSYEQGVAPASNDSAGCRQALSNGVGLFSSSVTFPVVMRAAPTITLYTVTGTASSLSVGTSVGSSGFFATESGGTTNSSTRFHYAASIEL